METELKTYHCSVCGITIESTVLPDKCPGCKNNKSIGEVITNITE